jgi:hypothetical protein
LYSTVIHCETFLPSFSAGLKRICLAAAIAFSVNPSGSPFTTEMFATCPDDASTNRNFTNPVTLFFLASSVNPGSGLCVITAFLVTSRGLNVRL